MALPSVTLARLVGHANLAASYVRPVRPSRKPFTEATKAKRPVRLTFNRGLVDNVTITALASVGVFGAELPYPTQHLPQDANGRTSPGIDPATGLANGSYVETVKAVVGQTATATTAVGVSPVIMLNGGKGYTSAPSVTFSAPASGTTATGTAVIDAETTQVVGIIVTNAGSGYTAAAAPTITIAAPDLANGIQATAACGLGQIKTVNTHIPYAANAPTTDAAAVWVVEWRDRIIACSSGVALSSYSAGHGATKAEQHVMGGNSANGFTVASATHGDGTTAICAVTFGTAGTNDANFGIPAGDTIRVYRGKVKTVVPASQLVGMQVRDVPALELMYVGVSGAGTIDTTSVTVTLEPAC